MIQTLSKMDIQFVKPTEEFLAREASGELSPEVTQKYRIFLERVNAEFLSHDAVTKNAYTCWFQSGQASMTDLRNLAIQFSIFSNYFPIAQLKKVINSGSLESMRLSKEILMNELGVVFKDPNKEKTDSEDESGLVSTTGSIEGGRFHFRAAHFEWMLDFGKPLGLEFDDMGRMRDAISGTKFFCDELERLYGGEDENISAGAGFAVENWAAAGFWQELEDGLQHIKDTQIPELPLAFWKFHNMIEAQHADHTHHELEEIYFTEGFDEEKFIAGGIEMLAGVKAFWDGLEEQRQNS